MASTAARVRAITSQISTLTTEIQLYGAVTTLIISQRTPLSRVLIGDEQQLPKG